MKNRIGKFLSVVLCVFVTTVFSVPVFADDATGSEAAGTANVAAIGDTEYETLAKALDAAEADDEITLLANVTEDVTIAEDKDVTLNLSEYTLTNAKSHTITNNGTLVIRGSGTVTNTSNNCASLANFGKATLESGTLTREAGTAKGYYVVFNRNTFVMNGGTVINTNTNHTASVIANGDMNKADDHADTVTINGGTVTVDTVNPIALKNNEWEGCEITVNGGTFNSSSPDKTLINQCVQNWGIANITGGTFNGKITTWSYDGAPTVAHTTIDGSNVIIISPADSGAGHAVGIGNYNKTGTPIVEIKYANVTGEIGSLLSAGTIAVSGGNYSEEIADEYLADDVVLRTYKGAGEYKFNAHKHVWTEVIDKEVTCTQNGEKHLVCDDCGLDLEDSQEVIRAEGHYWSDEYTTDKAETCTEDGQQSKHCRDCGAINKKSVKAIPATGHKWAEEKTVDKKATCTEDGQKSIHCKTCGAIDESSIEVIAKTGHTWAHYKKAAGNLKNGTEYDYCTICKEKKNVKTLAGYSTITVKSFKATAGKKCFTAKWTKASKANQKKMTGYQIRYSTKSSMSGAKMVTAGKTSASKKITKLSSKKKYYVQARTYTKVNGITFYSSWSAKKTVKTK